jgi:hypothetical protein
MFVSPISVFDPSLRQWLVFWIGVLVPKDWHSIHHLLENKYILPRKYSQNLPGNQVHFCERQMYWSAPKQKSPNTHRHWGKQNGKILLTFHPPPRRRQLVLQRNGKPSIKDFDG